MTTLSPVLRATLERLAARAAITEASERLDYSDPERARLTDDYHDTLISVFAVLEEAGIPLPDPKDPETQRAAWL